MKAKVETIFAFLLLLAFLLFSLPQQTLADQQDYVYPVTETNCEQINATAYRFQPGDTLNLTYTVQGPVTVCYEENWTCYSVITYPPGYYTETSYARFWELWFIDGKQTGYSYTSAGIGTGYDFSRGKDGIHEEGEHTLKIVYLFKGYGDFEGFYELNFLSERRATLEELNLPISTIPLLISGVSGAAIAFAVSAVIWRKKNSAKKEVKNDE